MSDETEKNNRGAGAAAGGPRWTVIVPVYNEEAYLEATLASLEAQTAGPFRLVAVDNASTDRSYEIAAQFAAEARNALTTVIREQRPGQAPALEAGIAEASTEFVAICDADTAYPPDYLERAAAIFDEEGEATVAVVAFDARPEAGAKDVAARIKGRAVSMLLARQCHGGGYAHAFRREALLRAGGYSPGLWPYCVKDHELMHRVSKEGRIAYRYGHWVRPSDRRSDRSSVRWTLFERIMYHATPHAAKDWFFYSFLKRRFEARGVRDLNLRKRDWEDAAA